MNRKTILSVAAAFALFLCQSGFAQTPALQSLMRDAGVSEEAGRAVPVPGVPESVAGPYDQGNENAVQYLPENNKEPGFDWSLSFEWRRPAGVDDWRKGLTDIMDGKEYILTGAVPAYFQASETGGVKCVLSAKTRYAISGKPGFWGEYMTVALSSALPNCSLQKGYVLIKDIYASSAGGSCQLPATVRAFLDVIGFAEGTDDRYNYIFTHATFKSYGDHPRRVICQGKLCSSAAGRYQFLSKTWDSIARDMGLPDFTPPSQDKAAMEIIRRDGAYLLVEKSNVYANFEKAVYKLNRTWASFPGSPYGQHTHSMSTLWNRYNVFLPKYK